MANESLKKLKDTLIQTKKYTGLNINTDSLDKLRTSVNQMIDVMNQTRPGGPNSATGNISGTVPENLDKLDITIKATNPDGTTRVLNIKIDLKKLKEANRADGEKYIGLKDQLAVESQKLEGYGNYLVSLFA